MTTRNQDLALQELRFARKALDLLAARVDDLEAKVLRENQDPNATFALSKTCECVSRRLNETVGYLRADR